jgi:hypothetical protein
MERLRACDLAVYRFLRGSSAGVDAFDAARPIGMGRNFLGTYDLFADALRVGSGAIPFMLMPVTGSQPEISCSDRKVARRAVPQQVLG